MPRATEESLIVGLDIGTSKVAAIIGRLTEDGEVEIIGIGNYPSRGLKKGVVVNIDATVQSVSRAVEVAEQMAGTEVNAVHVGIAGSHIRSFDSKGMVVIRDQEVSAADIKRVIEVARAVAIPADQKILHILPQEFIVDEHTGIKDAIGMSGERLEAKVHLVTGGVSAAQNIVKCIRRCGLEVEDIILEQLASSYAVLTEDEKSLGVCLVDIGGGTTDLAIFVEGALQYSVSLPVAGDQVTNDVAVALRTPMASAERIKIEHGCALMERIPVNQIIEVPCVGDRGMRQIYQQSLVEVIEPRYTELFGLIYSEIKKSGLEHLLGSGIVLTGGSAKLAGVLELGEAVLGVPIRLGVPRNVAGLIDIVRDPIYATGVGLLLYGLQNKQHMLQGVLNKNSTTSAQGVWSKMKHWFQGYA